MLGYLVRGPLGGVASCWLQYLLGLQRLGHDVYFVEDSDDYPECYDPRTTDTGTDPTYGLEFAARIFDQVGFRERWAYHDAHASRWHGPCADRVLDICNSTDLLLNVGGANPIRPWLAEIPARVLVDLDPVFTQVRHLTDPAARARALQHTAFFTIGANVGLEQSTIPDDGLPWRPTRQPVVLDVWPVTPGPPQGRFTTVMVWDAYPSVVHDGVQYGMKSASFGPYLKLPAAVGPILELAVGAAPHTLLATNGWTVRDAAVEACDPCAYRRYIQRSRAEFSVAKQGYVTTRSGWFSDRSVAYLASGRPVLVQETGFSDWMLPGCGVLPFTSPEEACHGVEEIERRYTFHCKASREVAREYFDASKVLPVLIERAME